MQKTIVKYVSSITDDATSFQKKLHKKYNGKIGYVRRNIDFDIKHGVTRRKSLHFLIKSKMTPHFLTYEKAKVAKKESKNFR